MSEIKINLSDENTKETPEKEAIGKLTSLNGYPYWLKSPIHLSDFSAMNIKSPLSFSIPSLYSSPETAKKINTLEDELAKNNKKIKELTKQAERSEAETEELKNTIKEQNKKMELRFLYSRIHPRAVEKLDPEDDVLGGFTNNQTVEMTVMAIDIRKSTELMLKAISPDEYAVFISGLTEKLKEIVIENYGVFDKFTGDGILAYFPLFYSGEKGVVNACVAAQDCHKRFTEYYESYKHIFSVVLETGLGIGIDHGSAKLVQINNEQTIVGSPVVYACRFSGAPAGHTYLNNIAYQRITESGLAAQKTRIKLKNEGWVVAYDLQNTEQEIITPQWATDEKN